MQDAIPDGTQKNDLLLFAAFEHRLTPCGNLSILGPYRNRFDYVGTLFRPCRMKTVGIKVPTLNRLQWYIINKELTMSALQFQSMDGKLVARLVIIPILRNKIGVQQGFAKFVTALPLEKWGVLAWCQKQCPI